MNKLKLLLIILCISFTSNVMAQSVYTTKTGEKYHKSSCSYLKYSKYKVELIDAIKYGYDPCSRCKPGKRTQDSNVSELTNSESVNTFSEPTNSSSKKATATQCTGKTQAGKRCKRRTKKANGRCYQH